MKQITDFTKAGAFCKSCIKPGGHEEDGHYLVDILTDTRSQMEEAKMKDAADATESGELTFDKMTLVQRIKAIDAVLDEDIRPMLVNGWWKYGNY